MIFIYYYYSAKMNRVVFMLLIAVAFAMIAVPSEGI
jgi:hypothetical protein